MASASAALSWYQTCDVVFPNSHLEFATILPRPVPPPEVKQQMKDTGEPVGICTGDKRIVWDPSGEVYVHEADGRSAYFHRRPTIKSAIKCPYGAYFQFHPDGSVSVKANGGTIYYSPHAEMEPPTEWTWLAKKWDAEEESYLFEGIDYEPEPEYDSDIDADAGSDSDSDDGPRCGPRCCRGCWKNALTPDQREAFELSSQLGFYERILVHYTKEAAETDDTEKKEKAQSNITWFTECQQRSLERAAAFEARTGISLTKKAEDEKPADQKPMDDDAESTRSMDTEGDQYAYT
jgi:hypothetical protein